MSDLSRIRVVRVAVPIAFIASMLISYPLWTGWGRLYPRAPVIGALEGLERWASWWEVPLAAALCAMLAGVALARTPRGAAGAAAGALVSLLLLALGDQMRWQPWAYQFAIMLLALAVPLPEAEHAAAPPGGHHRARPAAADPASERRLNAWRVAVALTYVWSGVQKLAGGGSGLLLPFARPLAQAFGVGAGGMLLLLNAGTAVVEIAIGVGLVTARFRRPAIVGAVLTHVTIIALLATIGRDPALVVWPWNLGLAVITVAIFAGASNGPRWRAVLAPRQGVAHAAALLLIGVMPAFSLVGGWDPYLSAALYSGNLGSAYVQWVGGGAPGGAAADPVPAPPALVDPRAPDRRLVGLPQWAMSELRVAGYPSLRVHRQLARRLCARARPSHRMVLVARRRLTITEMARWMVARRRGILAGTPQRIYDCPALLSR